MPDFSFTEDSRWANLPDDQKTSVLDAAFADQVGSDPRFASLDTATQQSVRERFQQDALSRQQPQQQFAGQNPSQAAGQFRGFGENMKNLIGGSFQDTWGFVNMADDVVSGNIDEDTPSIIADSIARGSAKYIPPALQETHETLGRVTKHWEEAKGAKESILSALYAAKETAKEALTNWEGVAYLSAESLGNMAPAMAGALGGAKVAGLAATPTAHPLIIAGASATGGIIGAFTGSFGPEAGAKFVDEVTQELYRRKLDPTEENIALVLQDNKFVETAISKARLKAVGTAGTDAVLSLGVGKMATAPIRNATRQATENLGKAASREAIAADAARILGNRGVGSKLATGGKMLAAETATEPISEAAGQLLADGKLDMGELVGETLGGLGMSPMSAVVDKTAFGTKLAAGVAKDAFTPTPPDVKQAKKLNDTTIKHDYKQKKEAAVQAGNVDNYVDPANAETYDPVLAVNSLAEINKQENVAPDKVALNLDQANEVYSTLQEQIVTKATEASALFQKIAAKTATKSEIKRAKDLEKEVNLLDKALGKMGATINSMQQTGVTPAEMQTDLYTAAKSGDSEAFKNSVYKSFGSSSGGGDIGTTLGRATAKSQEVGGDVKALMGAVQTLDSSKKAWQTSNEKVGENKNMSDVQQDIFQGSPGFKGIQNYHKAMAQALMVQKPEAAKQQLQQLTRFATDRKAQAATLRSILDTLTAGKEVSPADQAAFAAINQKRKSPMVIRPAMSDAFVATKELEAQALEDAVTVGRELLNLDKAPAAVKKPTKIPQAKTGIDSLVRNKENPLQTPESHLAHHYDQLSPADQALMKDAYDLIVDTVSYKSAAGTGKDRITLNALEGMLKRRKEQANKTTTDLPGAEKVKAPSADEAGTTNNTSDVSDASSPSGVTSTVVDAETPSQPSQAKEPALDKTEEQALRDKINAQVPGYENSPNTTYAPTKAKETAAEVKAEGEALAQEISKSLPDGESMTFDGEQRGVYLFTPEGGFWQGQESTLAVKEMTAEAVQKQLEETRAKYQKKAEPNAIQETFTVKSNDVMQKNILHNVDDLTTVLSEVTTDETLLTMEDIDTEISLYERIKKCVG